VLERSVLNTEPVFQVIEDNNVVTLLADWSEGDEEVEELLGALGSKQLPVVAIFPAGDPYRPKKLSGFYSRGELIRKLQDAGPSSNTAVPLVASGR
jgi:thiol:disulfide interchange protein